MNEDFNNNYFDSNNDEETTPRQKKNKKNKKKKSNSVLIVILCAVIAGGIAGGTFFGLRALTGDGGIVKPSKAADVTESNETISEVDSVDVKNYTSSSSLDVSGLVEETLPSLVSITNVSVSDTQNFYNFFFNGGNTQQENVELGSGVIVGQSKTELLVVTNAHMVEGAKTLTCTFFDEQSYEAFIKGSDADVDIAVIAIKLTNMKKDTLSKIKIATFGDSDKAKVGQQVVAIGNANGKGQSVTTGIISALNRTLQTSSVGLIQTDAAINPGNSGGALFNMNGQVIGINNSKYVSTELEGMGFAIPASQVKPIAENFMNRKTREKLATEKSGYLGIEGKDVTADVEQAYGVPQGIFVSGVTAGGPAAKAGIKENYIIVKFDGVAVRTIAALKSNLLYYAAGESVEVVCKVANGNKYEDKTFKVTLGKNPNKSSDENNLNPGNGFSGNGNNNNNSNNNPFGNFFNFDFGQ